MWEEQRTPTVVRNFFGTARPLSAKGRLALARALMIVGEREQAEGLVRQTWRDDALSRDVESAVLQSFGAFITRDDHKERMDGRLDAGDTEGGMRAAMRLGGNELAIAKARVAVASK